MDKRVENLTKTAKPGGPDNGLQRLAGEALGTAWLLITIVGSGIMANQLSGGNTGLALFVHAASIGAILVVLVVSLGPLCGAHFNPAVTFAFLLRREISAPMAIAYMVVQVAAAIVGVVVAHIMFDKAPIDWGSQARTGLGQWVAEVLSGFALVFAILAAVRTNKAAVPYIVGLVVMGGIIFTSSTFFANPAVALARSFTDTFTGIRPADVPAFVICQFVGAGIAVIVERWLYAGWK